MKTARLLPLILLCGCSHTFLLPPTPAIPAPPTVAPDKFGGSKIPEGFEPGADGDGPNLSREPKANLCDSLGGAEKLTCLMGQISPEQSGEGKPIRPLLQENDVPWTPGPWGLKANPTFCRNGYEKTPEAKFIDPSRTITIWQKCVNGQWRFMYWVSRTRAK